MVVPHAVYRGYFIWVFINGGKTLVESFIDDDPSTLGDLSTSPIFIDIPINSYDDGQYLIIFHLL